MSDYDKKNDVYANKDDLYKRDAVKKDEPSALERDWEQTKHDLTGGKKGVELNQDVGDTVKQGLGKEVTPPIPVPNYKK